MDLAFKKVIQNCLTLTSCLTFSGFQSHVREMCTSRDVVVENPGFVGFPVDLIQQFNNNRTTINLMILKLKNVNCSDPTYKEWYIRFTMVLSTFFLWSRVYEISLSFKSSISNVFLQMQLTESRFRNNDYLNYFYAWSQVYQYI